MKLLALLLVGLSGYGIDSKEFEPLYCFAISSKRYVLFNVDSTGIPILRKASAHGLGHLIEPYSEDEAPLELPAPRIPLHEIGVARWQHDLWIKIIEAAVAGNPDQVRLDWHPSLTRPAAQRFSASSPHLLAWLDQYNGMKAYEEQIRPFGFLLVYTPKGRVFADPPDVESCVVEQLKRGRPAKRQDLKPIAPFDSDPVKALANVFDRETGEFIGSVYLKTYAEALCQYHLSSEDKFDNGQFLDRGQTEKRHVLAIELAWIGKEANRVSSSGEQDPTISAMAQFHVVAESRFGD